MMMYNPFLSVIYALILPYYTKDEKTTRRLNRIYYRLLNKGEKDAVVKTQTAL